MTFRPSEQNFYDLLEVPRTAAHHEIVAAYQKAKEAYAPDSPALYTMFSKEEAAELRRLIDEAFMVLGNQTKRREYDMILLAREGRLDTAVDRPATIKPQNESSARTLATNSAAERAQNGAPVPPPAAQNTIPDGFARSRLSVYEVKTEMENEISNQKSFDGAFLRKIRQYKNIHIDNLSKETRISRSYLVAVEAEDYDALPAPVFVRGFIVQLARLYGVDETLAANSYMARMSKRN